jgi:hypothetical protein
MSAFQKQKQQIKSLKMVSNKSKDVERQMTPGKNILSTYHQ